MRTAKIAFTLAMALTFATTATARPAGGFEG
jgi:hypothetical protein